MPTVTRDDITRIAHKVLGAAGALDEHAATVGSHLADANMAGHDSHGFIRIPQYVTDIRDGSLDPKAQPEVMSEDGGTAKVDGKSTFGQVVATFATQLGVKKAKQSGIGMVTMGNLTHTGRIGTYPEMATREGMAAIMCTGQISSGKGGVAPFGGREGRLSTNPISMAFPYKPDAPVLLDFATSMAAEGKLRVYKARGDTLPDEWVLNSDGAPSRDPNDYYNGGAILPVGGLQGGHKGYGLSFMVTLLGGLLGGYGMPAKGGRTFGAGSFITVIDLGRIASDEEIRGEVGRLVDYVKDTPPMEGSKGVLFPGEIESMTRQERVANGVMIEQDTWDAVGELIDEFGLREELSPLPD